MADEGRNVKINLSFALDQQTANRVSAAIEAMSKKGEQAAAKATSGAGKSGLQGIQETAAKLQGIGLAISGAAAGLGTALTLSAKGYVAQVGTSEQVSRRWLGASKEIELAQLKIGRAVATAIVPALETAASLADKVAAFAEQHQPVVKAGVIAVGSAAAIGATVTTVGTIASKVAPLFQTGGALAGLATTGSAVGNFIKTIGPNFALGARLAQLGGTGQVAGGLGQVLGGTAAAGSTALALGAGGLGAGLGVAIYDAIAKATGRMSAGEIGGKGLTVAAYGVGSLFGKGAEWGKFMGELTGQLEKTGTAAKAAGQGIDFTGAQISAYHSYMRQTQESERSYRRQIFTMNRDFQRQMEYGEEDHLRTRQRAMRDFMRQEGYAEQDYFRQRRLQARDFNIEMERTEYDHQKELRRGREDHEWRLKTIIMQGDGMAFWEENRQYNLQLQRGEEDFSTQQQRREEDFSRQRQDAANEFAITRQRSLENFQIQQKDAETDFNIQRQRTRDQFKIQLTDLAYQHSEETRIRRQGLLDQLRDLQGNLEQERIMRMEFSQAMLTDLQNAVDTAKTGKNLLSGTGQVGGYVGPGIYRLHKKEFVLNAETTSAAETLAGSSLNQANILGMMAQGGGPGSGQRGLVYNDYRTFARGLAPEEIAQIKTDTRRILMEVVDGTAI